MLVLDSSIGCIEADESEVLVLYRSAPIVMTPSSGSRPTSMEAYICATQRKSQTKVHLALVADNRRIYVYAESLKASDAAGMERSLQQAISCARSMGLSPELVNLAYRPAMREVVLRNIKVLRLPGSKWIAALKAGLPGAPLLPLQSPTGASVKNSAPAPEKTEQPASAPAASTPPLAVVHPAGAAPVSAAESSGLSRGERSSVGMLQLQKELQLMAAERDALLAQLQQLSVVHQEVVMELTVQRDEAAKVTAEIERMTRSEGQLKEAAAATESLRSELQDLAGKLQESQRAAEELKAVNTGLAAELAAAKDERKALLAERKSLLKKGEAAAAQHEKVMEQNRALQRELNELQTEREAESGRMASLEQDLYTLAAELGTASAEVGGVRAELSAARTGVATAEAELLVARSKVVAAESKGAAIWRKLKATELELERSRAELAAAVSKLPSPLLPGESPPGSMVDSSAPPPELLQSAKAQGREPGAELPAVAPSQGTEPAPIEFEEPTPGIPEQTAVAKQTPVQQKTPVQDKAPPPNVEKPPVPDETPPVLQETPVLTPPKPAAPTGADEPHTAPADYQQPPMPTPPRPTSDHQQTSSVGGAEENASGREPEILHDLRAVEQTLDVASSWYGVDAVKVDPAFADPPGPDAGAQPVQADAAPALVKPHEFPPFGELQENFFSAAEDSAPVGQFVLRPDLKVIEYLNVEDVVELHQSINNANMAPDGKGQESCRGYICSLKCGDKFQVFAAIYGTRSGRTTIYAPERQPEDEAGYAGAVRGAISFAEEVGLMMEAVKGGTAALQDDCIVQCPVLKKAA